MCLYIPGSLVPRHSSFKLKSWLQRVDFAFHYIIQRAGHYFIFIYTKPDLTLPLISVLFLFPLVSTIEIIVTKIPL